MKLFMRRAAAFLRRDVIEALSYKLPVLFAFVGMAGQVLTFFFIAKVVGSGVNAPLESYGGDYFAFVLVGIAFAGYQGAALNSLSRAINQEQGFGTLEAILITGTPLSTMLFSASLWSMLYTTGRVLVTLAFGVFFLRADLSGANPVAAAVVVLMMVAALTGFALFAAGFLLVFKRSGPVSMIFNGLSVLLAGVYFPVSVLPEALQAGARCLPLTHALEALRRAILSGAGVSDLTSELAILAAFAVILIPLGTLFLSWSLRRAKDDGSLTFI